MQNSTDSSERTPRINSRSGANPSLLREFFRSKTPLILLLTLSGCGFPLTELDKTYAQAMDCMKGNPTEFSEKKVCNPDDPNSLQKEILEKCDIDTGSSTPKDIAASLESAIDDRCVQFKQAH